MCYNQSYKSSIHSDVNLGFGYGIVYGNHSGHFEHPVWLPDRSACLFLTGEAFQEGAKSPSGKLLSGLLERYADSGESFLRDLNGAFAGLIIDYAKKKAVIFNDRYGLERLYVHEGEEGIYVASEAKAILVAAPKTRSIRPDSLGEWFTCGAVMGGKTLFKDIETAPSGCVLTFGPERSLRTSTYFDKQEWRTLERLSPDVYYKCLRERFEACLPVYLEDPGSVAMSITGGLDSRMILAFAEKLPAEMRSYTFGGMYRECADVRLAKVLAEKLGLSHEVLTVQR